MKLDLKALTKIVRSIVSTHEEEIGCDDCYAEVDIFAEMVLQGKDADSALPLIKYHLDHCGNCREEFEALLETLTAMDA
ncbi:MAG: hypothetical protein IMY76_02250 [Chloroflexi bacterium]|nr:hypothetical protein [Chloroflexota bacterium]